MKKVIFLVMMLIVCLFAKVYADYITDIWGTGINHEVRFNSGGRLILSSDVVTADGDPMVVPYTDLPAASSGTFTDTGSEGGVYLTTASLISGTTSIYDGAAFTDATYTFTQITFPRNIQAVFTNYATYTTTVSATLTVYGVDSKGIDTTDVITVSTNTAYGVKAFATISTMTLSGWSSAGALFAGTTVCLHIGVSNKIGLCGDVRASADVYKITRAGVDISTIAAISGCIDVSNDTIDLSKSIVPNGTVDWLWQIRKKVKQSTD